MTLEEQRIEFSNRKFLATPLAGLLVWFIIGIIGVFASKFTAVWAIFIGTGSIVYLGLFIAKFTGENFLEKTNQKTNSTRFFSIGL